MWNSLNSNLWVCVLVEARRETVVFSLFPFYANTCSFLINSFACSEWHDAGGDGPASKDAAVDFVPCVEGWRMAGLLCQVFILWPLLSHSRLTWAFGANWLLIAWAFSMLQKRAHFKGNQFNEIIYQGLSRHLNTHTPPPSFHAVFTTWQASHKALRWKLPAERVHVVIVIMGLHRVSHPLLWVPLMESVKEMMKKCIIYRIWKYIYVCVCVHFQTNMSDLCNVFMRKACVL